MNHFELNYDGSVERLDWNKSVDAQAKALGWMLDKVFPPDKPLPKGIPETQAAISSELRDIESLFMARNKEACVMECAIVEALTWLDSGASGKAHETLSVTLEKLSSMRAL